MLNVANFLNFTSSLLMLFFVQPLSGNCYKLPNVIIFTCIQTFITILSSLLNGVTVAAFSWYTVSKFAKKRTHLRGIIQRAGSPLVV